MTKTKTTWHLIFRIFYTSFFTILNIVLLGLLLITPADAIQQALDNRQLYNVFAIAGCYLLTVILATLIYASRLYTNRTVLAAIPKTWIPIEKGEVNKNVRRMIVASLSRSAAITWDSRPRISHQPATIVSEPDNRESIAKPPAAEIQDKKKVGFLHKRFMQPEKDEETVAIPPSRPVWGEISHDGWASPRSPDLPNLQFTTVILELPHLIEARAVSLAPTDPESSDQPVPDIRVVHLLQRPASMGLRDYFAHLTGFNIITSPSTAAEFLDAYEYARFSTRALSEDRFRDLMKQFAELLRSMVVLDPTVLLEFDVEPESDIDSDATSSPTPITPCSRSLASSRSVISRTGSEGTIRTTASRRVPTNGTTGVGRPEFSTAPATPRSRKKPTSRSPSANTFAQSRIPYQGSSSSSNESLRSTSQGSVIKLSMTNDEGSLPYILNLSPSQ